MISYKSNIIIHATCNVLSSYLSYVTKKIQIETNQLQDQLNKLEKNALSSADYIFLSNSYCSMITANKTYQQKMNNIALILQDISTSYLHEQKFSQYYLDELNLHLKYLSSTSHK